MSKIILSVINDLTIDQRVHKVCTTLTDAGHQVLLVGRQKKDSLPLQPRAYDTHRMRLFFEKGKLFYLEYNIRLFFFLLFHKSDILTANDLDTLLANYFASKIKRSRLIYDTHEYFTEMPELVARPVSQKVWLKLEQWLFTKADAISTVNHSLAKIYEGKYRRKLVVIRNLPFKQTLSVNNESKSNIVIYQGNVNLSRGLELMLEALKLLPDVDFWVVGPGDLLEDMKKLAVEFNVNQRVKFFGQIPFKELPEITRQAKIGISIEQPLGLNSTLCLPNKLMDYIQAGLPVIAAPLPEIKNIFDQYHVGLLLENYTASSLATNIRSLIDDKELYEQYSRNSKAAATELTWENESHHLLAMYQ